VFKATHLLTLSQQLGGGEYRHVAAGRCAETSVNFYRTTRRHNAEDSGYFLRNISPRKCLCNQMLLNESVSSVHRLDCRRRDMPGCCCSQNQGAGGRPRQIDRQFCGAKWCAWHRTARCVCMAETARNDFMEEGGHPGIGFGHRSGWAPLPPLNWQRGTAQQ
jgi:hypothetical protein